jgi:hypothetical protein
VTKNKQDMQDRARIFIHKNSQILTVIGFLIVFSSFIVREGLRDNLRFWTASLKSAEDAYYSDNDMGDEGVQLHRLEMGNQIILRRLLPNDYKELVQRLTAEQIDLDRWRLAAITRRIRPMYGLLMGIPLSVQRSIAPKIDKALSEMLADQKLLSQLSSQQDSDISSELKNVEADIVKFDGEMTDIGSKCVSEVHKMLSMYDSASDYTNVLIYLLYAIGWGLALASKVWGEKEITATT